MVDKSTLPTDLVMVRHGESIGNEASRAYRSGRADHYTKEFLGSPGCRWELTPKGQEQAKLAGQWVLNHLNLDIDRYYVSPYDRTLQTAELMDLPGAAWMVDDRVRERSHGDTEVIHPGQYEDEFYTNLLSSRADPFYHRWPNGESFADVVMRWRDLFGTLAREVSDGVVLVVSHGHAINAAQMGIERIDSIRWHREKQLPHRKIWNCQIVHYTRSDPETGETKDRMTHYRNVRPWRERKKGPRKGTIYASDDQGEWLPIERKKYDSQGLRDLRLSRDAED